MGLDILNLLESGNKTMAWLGAVALAAGGTAIVVVVYIQIQRLRRRLPGLTWPVLLTNWKPALPAHATRPRQSEVQARSEIKAAPAAAGLAAYRAVQAAVPAQPGRGETGELGLEALDAMLRRLRRAAETLDEIALKSGRATGANVAYESFINGMDVEYLHRQN